MKFEWDEDKNTKNKENHKIYFENYDHDYKCKIYEDHTYEIK